MKHFSAFAGGVALALIMIPIVARTTEEMLKLVPHSLREGALALGAPQWRVTWAWLFPLRLLELQLERCWRSRASLEKQRHCCLPRSVAVSSLTSLESSRSLR